MSSQATPQRFVSSPSPPAYSPASSPSFGPCDSSPPSSPAPEPLSLSPPASPGPAHPFAASTKAVRAPRLYERRVSRVEFDNISFRADLLESPVRDGHTTSISVHPLAGSANTAWTPPEWEKKPAQRQARTMSMASISSSDTLEPRMLFESGRRADSDCDNISIDLSDDEETKPVPAKARRKLEQDAWDDAISKAVDFADGVIALA